MWQVLIEHSSFEAWKLLPEVDTNVPNVPTNVNKQHGIFVILLCGQLSHESTLQPSRLPAMLRQPVHEVSQIVRVVLIPIEQRSFRIEPLLERTIFQILYLLIIVPGEKRGHGIECYTTRVDTATCQREMF